MSDRNEHPLREHHVGEVTLTETTTAKVSVEWVRTHSGGMAWAPVVLCSGGAVYLDERGATVVMSRDGARALGGMLLSAYATAGRLQPYPGGPMQ